MKKLSLVLIAFLALNLQGCFFIAGAAAGAAAIAIVYDHRTMDSILQDQRIDRDIQRKIHDDPELRDNTHISVTSFGQVVLLTGEATTPELRKKAEETAWTVHGITRIYNAITIQEPTSALSHANDSWITAKIKTEMLSAKGLKPASIKVVTENGTVYLMGTVTHEQETTVVDIARHTSGVQKVVKIFQYETKTSESDVKASKPPVQTLSSNQQDDPLSTATTHPVDDEQPLIQDDGK
jgi:osmotically-inducible protein OsmY